MRLREIGSNQQPMLMGQQQLQVQSSQNFEVSENKEK